MDAHPASRLSRLALVAVLFISSTGCVSLRLVDGADGLPQTVILESVPFHPQTEFYCGPAALATVLEHGGVVVDADTLAERVFTPGLEGSLQAELIATARSKGLLAYRLTEQVGAVMAEVAEGRPVLVLKNQGLESRPIWHYAVVVGYDQDTNQLILRSGTRREQRISANRWVPRWNRAGRWALVVLAPGQWPVEVDRDRWIAAAADFEVAADPSAAARVWDQTTDRWPDAVLAWLGLGNVEFRRSDFKAAIDAYRRALELDPTHAAVQFNLAVALKRSGAPCKALPLLQELTKHDLLDERAMTRHNEAARMCQVSKH